MQRKRIPAKPNIRTSGPRPAAPLRSAAQRKHRRRYCDTRRNGADPAGWHTGWRMAWALAVEIVREADNLQSSPLTLATAAITAALPPLLGSGHPMAQARTLTLAWTRHRDREPDHGNCRSQVALTLFQAQGILWIQDCVQRPYLNSARSLSRRAFQGRHRNHGPHGCAGKPYCPAQSPTVEPVEIAAAPGR